MKHNIVNKQDYRYYFKKKLQGLTDSEKTDRMHVYRDRCLKTAVNNQNENWFAQKLDKVKIRYKRQRIMGLRIFDFFIADLGCAIEIDGPEHDAKYDEYRDIYNYLRSAIVILRVKNKSEEDALSAIDFINRLEKWPERRKKLKIQGKGIHPPDLTNPNHPYWK